jgi:cytochrome c biogenesis factor
MLNSILFNFIKYTYSSLQKKKKKKKNRPPCLLGIYVLVKGLIIFTLMVVTSFYSVKFVLQNQNQASSGRQTRSAGQVQPQQKVKEETRE